MTMRLMYKNLIDTATLTADPLMVSTLDVGNLQLTCRCRVARSVPFDPSPFDQQIEGDLAAYSEVSGLSLWRHNLSDTATIKLELYSQVGQTGTLAYDSGWVLAVEAGLFTDWDFRWSTLWFTPTSCYSFRITVRDDFNTDEYIEISRAVFGNYVEPTYNPSYGLELAWEEDTKQFRTDGGSLHSDPTTAFRGIKLKLDGIDETDRTTFMDMLRVVGRRTDFLISVYPEVGGALERDYEMLVKLTQRTSQVLPYYSSYSQSMQMEEI